MNTLPKNLRYAIEFFEGLPGIGPKTAKRLGFYLLRLPERSLEEFAQNLNHLKKTTKYCKICYNLTEDEVCAICTDESRNKKTLVVVEDVLDLLTFESGTMFDGVYHVLHGRIDPLNYIGPDDIFIPQLIKRVKKNEDGVEEIIIATNPNTEGEATAMYIKSQIEDLNNTPSIMVTRLAYGLPIGGDLEYADYMTLKRAIEGRKQM
ncbi:recombination protein RecR [Candidatus Roizmanbacteria bacterium RIFCSPHIGHO2_01_FULL_39_12b]|uniref:Recombination protein RecR n=1 Tax=Candidatus Roizmanbacteria bacterium RIFCSPHIGHO2_01_FULL_39_12b TaxID=1802030 RepID=A0A1F7G7P7_9BACT|nr:MAG: recombination protein RecR [Candidatus Roizmanbacteria bacterium RIFCSPHIGHO2_01_FULL_39_12b]